MDPLEELLGWATSHGVKLNGITPERIPGRGTGIVATRDILADEIVLDVPTSCLRTLSTVPKSRLRKLPSRISVQGILAADFVLDRSTKYTVWNAILPSLSDFSGMPLLWDPALQALLPFRSAKMLAKQQSKFDRDFATFSTSFPDHTTKEGREEAMKSFRYHWLLVNSRTFYYMDAALKRRPNLTTDDHLSLQPVADLFNHTDEGGCHVAYASDGYSFRATVPFKKGDEVKICYGRHSNDFLLIEYGFTMDENAWDEVVLDEVILSRFDEKGKERLEGVGFLGNYVLDKEQVCHRTQVALRLLCCRVGEWKKFVDGNLDGEESQEAVDSLLLELLREYRVKAEGTMADVKGLEAGEQDQRELLFRRWEQVCRLLDSRISSLELENKS
ncbi:SET domain-containing protein [Xylariaceae sp. FL1272]|nr:SET domain-containing protein [Xylariaceae sp. FL1272]